MAAEICGVFPTRFTADGSPGVQTEGSAKRCAWILFAHESGPLFSFGIDGLWNSGCSENECEL